MKESEPWTIDHAQDLMEMLDNKAYKPTKPVEYKTMEGWRHDEYYNWTQKELDNATDGLIGYRNGRYCYMLPLWDEG